MQRTQECLLPFTPPVRHPVPLPLTHHNPCLMRPPLSILVCLIIAPWLAQAQPSAMQTELIPLQYRSPLGMGEALELQTDPRTGLYRLHVDPSTDTSAAYVRFNEDTNQLLLTGPAPSMPAARRLVEFADVPPRQIVVEVQIVETNRQVLLDAGLDWQRLLDRTRLTFNYAYDATDADEEIVDVHRTERDDNVLQDETTTRTADRDRSRSSLGVRLGTAYSLGEFINVLRYRSPRRWARAATSSWTSPPR